MSTACGLRIGIVYETFETYASRPGDPIDAHVEYEPEVTIETLEASIRAIGHEPVRLGSPHDLLAAGRAPDVDCALTIAEGHGSRNREAWAPVLLEMLGVPTLGSDALTLSLSLDKAWAGAVLRDAGLPVVEQCSFAAAASIADARLPAAFPLFVKPRWEGTAKGIRPTSRVEDRAGLAREVERVTRVYGQPALVEAFLSGPEYTATIVGNDPPRALPVVQRALDAETGIGVHALAADGERKHHTPGVLDADLEAELQGIALRSYEVLGCLDFARVDLRLDASGRPFFLEINPLPTFAPDGTFGILAELEGRPLSGLLGEVLGAGLVRLGLLGGAEEEA